MITTHLNHYLINFDYGLTKVQKVLSIKSIGNEIHFITGHLSTRLTLELAGFIHIRNQMVILLCTAEKNTVLTIFLVTNFGAG